MANRTDVDESVELQKLLPTATGVETDKENCPGNEGPKLPLLEDRSSPHAPHPQREDGDASSTEPAMTEADQELIKAIEESDESAVEDCLFSKKADPNFSHGPKNVQCLHLAAKNGNLNIVKLLVKAEANVNATDSEGVTPLHVAAEAGLIDVIEFLVQSGADLNAKDWAIIKEDTKRGNPSVPLDEAVPSKFTDKISHENEMTSAHPEENEASASEPSNRTSRNEQRATRETPLHRAIRTGHLGSVKKLLALGAKVEAVNGQEKTMLHLAAESGHIDVIELLLKNKANPKVKDENGDDPFLLLVKFMAQKKTRDMKRYKEGLDLLIKVGLRVNGAFDQAAGAKLLHQVVTIGQLEATKVLLSKTDISKTDISNAVDTEGNTVMHSCCMKGHADVLKALIGDVRTKWMINERDNKDWRPLHKAAHYGSTECIRILIRAGADLGLKTKAGVSAMTLILQLPQGPKILSEMFDKSITTNGIDPSEATCNLEFNYSILISKHKKQQMCVIEDILDMRNEQRTADLLRHPLIASFLFLKWRKIRLLFFAILIAFVLLVVGVTVDVWTALTYEKRLQNSSTIAADANDEPPVLRFQILLIFAGTIITLQETVRLVSMPAQYFKEAESYVKLGTLITSSILVFQPIPWSEWVHFVAAWAVLFGWAEVTFLIGRLPTFGVYALMFYSVAEHLGKLIIVYSFILFGFSFSFHIIFLKQKEAFSSPWSSLLRTVGMMTGDFNYDEYLTSGNHSMPATAHLIYFFFLMLVTLILMNLLIGLAVNDTQNLQKEGTVARLRKQAQFIIYLEDVVNNRLIHKIPYKCVIDKMDSWVNQQLKFSIQPSARNQNIRLPTAVVEEALSIAQEAQETAVESALNDTFDVVQECLSAVWNLDKRINVIQQDLSNLKKLAVESREATLSSKMKHFFGGKGSRITASQPAESADSIDNQPHSEAKEDNSAPQRQPSERAKQNSRTSKVTASSYDSDLREIKNLLIELKASINVTS